MMRLRVVVALLLVGAPVTAKPLPAAMKVAVKKGNPILTTEGVSVQLLDTWHEWTAVTAELADDGSALLLRSARCGMELDVEEEPTKIAVGIVDAKIANAKAMALHVKRKYRDSAKLFEQAWSKDPTTPVYATNYLAAVAMARDTERASKLLDDGIANGNISWFAWRLLVDPELRSLKTLAGAKALRAPTPSKLTLKKLGDGVAVSPLAVAAVTTSDSLGGKFLSFVELQSGKQTLRLPVKTSAQKAVADKLLASLGMEIAAASLSSDDEVIKLAGKANARADIKAAASVESHVVYIERTGGCDVSEFDFHAAATKL